MGLITSKEKNEESMQRIGSEQIVKTSTTNVANRMLDEMDEEEDNEREKERCTGGKTLNITYSRNKVTSPLPDASGLIPSEAKHLSVKFEEFPKESCSQPCVLPIRIQALGYLRADDMNHLTINISPRILVQNASFMKETKEAADRLDAEYQDGEESPMKISFEGTEYSKVMNNVQTTPKSSVMLEGRDSAANLPLPAPPTPPRVPPTMTLTVPSPSSVPLLNVSATPPAPPIPPYTGSAALPPPPRSMTDGSVPPPPPPLNRAKSLRLKRTASKLKRSTQMSNLYRLLKGKFEGSLRMKSPRWRKAKIGGAPGEKQGMADALIEITKRSAYFQQIEEDVKNHANLIIELKAVISSFRTKDMDELTKFHKDVEQSLEKLTDESQVLSRFEGFPVKKLESLRAAAALYLKLKKVLTDLENWKVKPPLEQLLNEFEAYFNKIKSEMEALERSKDEEAKKFESNNIHFDFATLERIKESLVEVSSSCMELALKEEREANAITVTTCGSKNEHPRKDHIKMLWRSFQLAFRIYSFAGGQDDRADKLSQELADEIVTDSQ
ncbi:hypothetical protein L6164_018729 [Bauhinia variegata]|uniref:Uncharacterized protein n=1 Tax=Bauhinia variegata TaxID=167791 RepID=A0ACB9NC35_BAUVA|nr:hypothetical protein L6164_018729 [Bauhinia variegata]